MEPETSGLKIVQVVSLGDVSLFCVNDKPTSSRAIQASPATDKPLLMLLKQLVHFLENTEKTMLTNPQLKNILHKEFNINIWGSHTLEADIYMTILKRFLKKWPRWDSVDLLVQRSKVDKSMQIEEILLQEYESLKKYLKEILELSHAPTQETMKKYYNSLAEKKNDAVLDIFCTREQLNTLIYRAPDPSGSIFNSHPAPTLAKIRFTSLSLHQVCYWPGFCIEIDAAKAFQYNRTNVFTLTHTLVNHNLGVLPEPPTISLYVHSRPKQKTKRAKSSEVPFETVTNFLNYLLDLLEDKETENANYLKCILEMVKTDLFHYQLPLDRNSEYMYYLNRHAYVRHLYQEPPEGFTTSLNEDKLKCAQYKLELQEFISPDVVFSVCTMPKVMEDGSLPNMTGEELLQYMLDDQEQWLCFRCSFCGIVFNGLGSVGDLKTHFGEVHGDEQNAACSRCQKVFAMPILASLRWFHKCVPEGGL